MAELRPVLIIIDDDPLITDTLHFVLSKHFEVCVADSRAQAKSLLRQLDEPPSLALVDLGLPDMPGLNVIEFCHRLYPLTDIMVITMFGDEANMMAAFAQGARGYLLKDGSEQDLARHVHDLHAGGSPMTPVIARQLLARLAPTLHERPSKSALPQPGAVGLSDRELEILSALSRGYTYQEVAGLLDISVHTVQTHVKNTYGKLDVHSRAEAVFEARQLGLL